MKNLYTQIGITPRDSYDACIEAGQGIARSFLEQSKFHKWVWDQFLEVFRPQIFYTRYTILQVAPILTALDSAERSTVFMTEYVSFISEIDQLKSTLIWSQGYSAPEDKDTLYSDFLSILTTEAYQYILRWAKESDASTAIRRWAVDSTSCILSGTQSSSHDRFTHASREFVQRICEQEKAKGKDKLNSFQKSVMLYWCLRAHFSGCPIIS